MSKTKTKIPVFEAITQREVLITYHGEKFLLREKSRGCLGIGTAIQLYRVKGLDTDHMREIGWTSSDNHSCNGMKESLAPTEFINMEKAKVLACKYIDTLLG